MTLMRMPLFVWTALSSMILVVFAFPILTATLSLLALDRIFGAHFFTTDMGGNAMMYVNLIWAWGHPEVYILVLPAFGIFSEIISTFSQKKLFGYVSMVVATMLITVLSFVVWAHHFFTMGAGAKVNAFFGIMTMAISIPTGVKVFNWLFTMFRGRIIFATPMLWFMGFLTTFVVGGMTGVLMAIPGADFQLHNSLFLIAHFHNMIIGGVLFGFFAGFTYWFPKMFGFTLHEGIGRYAFWCWISGFILAFIPLYLLGLMGMTRRLDHIDPASGAFLLLLVAAIGACVIMLGVGLQIAQIIVSVMQRKHHARADDPWNGRTLEWSTSSPPPAYNFATLPYVHGRDAYLMEKESSSKAVHRAVDTIHLPKNTGIGFIVGLCSFGFGFAMIWHMWWLAVLAIIAVALLIIARSFDEDTEYQVSVPIRP
jgi:cytochrome o ubiquinol oxidase subunit 1